MKKILPLACFAIALMCSTISRAQTDDEKAQKAKTANEERVAKEAYQSVTKHKKKKRVNLNDNYMGFGLGYVMGLGGDNAPFKSGINLNYSFGFPIVNNNLVLDFQFNSDVLFSQNTDWFASAYRIPNASAANLGLGFNEGISLGLSLVVYNSREMTVTVGALGGANFVMLPDHIDDVAGMGTLDLVIAFHYGIKSSLYLGEHFLFDAEYVRSATNSITASNTGVPDNTLPINLDIFRLWVSYRFDTWW